MGLCQASLVAIETKNDLLRSCVQSSAGANAEVGVDELVVMWRSIFLLVNEVISVVSTCDINNSRIV